MGLDNDTRGRRRCCSSQALQQQFCRFILVVVLVILGLTLNVLRLNKAIYSTPSSSEPVVWPGVMANLSALIFVKTGAGNMQKLGPSLEASLLWRHRPAGVEFVLISDQQGSYLNSPVIDIVNTTVKDVPDGSWMSMLSKNSKDYIYHEQMSQGNATEEDHEKRGWPMDRLKFVPMLFYAADHYRDDTSGKFKFDWMIMMEDDTFFNTGTLMAVLAALDPKAPLYIGAVNYYQFDGLVSSFAHGGSGIVLSKGAMERLPLPGTEASKKIRARCFDAGVRFFIGDATLAGCLRESGVTMVKHFDDWFRAHLLDQRENIVFTNDDRCIPVIGFHHVKRFDDLVLFEEAIIDEWSHRRQPTVSQATYGLTESWDRKMTRILDSMPTVRRHTVFQRLALRTIIDAQTQSPYNISAPFIAIRGSTVTPSLKAGGSIRLAPLPNGASSPDHCHAACLSSQTCISWRFSQNATSADGDVERCLGSKGFKIPTEEKDDKDVVSGLILDRVDTSPCVSVPWGSPFSLF